MSVIDELGLPPLPEPLPRPIIDNHTHLASTHGYSGLPVAESLELAASVGVTRVIEVGCDVADARFAVDLAGRDPRVRAAVAIHPNDAARLVASAGEAALEEALAVIEGLVPSEVVVAVGETGLDYFRTRDAAGQAVQEMSFRRHIEWAKRHGRTLMIHDRDAHADILRVLDDAGVPERVVMHCFSGDADFARQCVERGFWLSYPGVVTFGSAGSLREALAVTPRDRILIETDAPYLTPKPCRGKANAPYLLPHTARFVAAELGVDVGEFCDLVVANTFAAYGKWGHDA